MEAANDHVSPREGVSGQLLWALVAGLFLYNVQRAATHSITYDEAMTFHNWVDAPWSEFYARYIPNNHFLHTALAKLSVDALGISKLALRLPALLGGLLFLVCAAACVRGLTRPGWWRPVAFLFVTLNPFVLDYLSLARGYGLASALLLAMFLCALRVQRSANEPAPSAYLGFASLGFLTLFSNPAFLYPCAALYGAFAWLLLAKHGPRCCVRFVLFGALPCALLLVATVYLPLGDSLRPGRFGFGSDTAGEMLRSMVEQSFDHHRGLLMLGETSARYREAIQETARIGIPGLLAILGALTLAAGTRLGKAHAGEPCEGSTLWLWLLGATLLGTCTLVVLASEVAGLPYPKTRTALFLAILFSLTLVAAGERLGAGSPGLRAVGLAARAIMGGCVLLFGLQLGAPYYGDWAFDAHSEELYTWLEQKAEERGGAPLQVLAYPFQHTHSLNFYRRRDAASWLEPVERATRRGKLRSELAGRTFDYAVLLAGTEGQAHIQRKWRPVYRDGLTGTVIAERRL